MTSRIDGRSGQSRVVSSKGEFVRKLWIGFLFVLLVAPASSNSVGFGEVDLKSFLNEPLRAEVPLRGAAAVRDSLRIRQAPEEAYRRVGLNRGSVPGDLAIEVRDDRVVLTTRRPVREPYVGILLEARWEGGRAMRELSLLLDPPGTFPGTDPVVSERPAPASPAAQVEETYRVRSGDTLFSIVQRSGISGVSDEQAMLAFLEANPGAFIDGNINALRADAELRIPTPAELESHGVDEARAEVRDQTRSWREARQAARAEATSAPATESEATAEPEATPEPEVPPAEEAESSTGADEESASQPEEPVAAAGEEPAREEAGVDEPEAAQEQETADSEMASGDEAVAEESGPEESVAEDRLEIISELQTEDNAAEMTASGQVTREALVSQRAQLDGMREELSRLREELGERGRLAEIASENMAELENQLAQLRAERTQLLTRLERAEARRDAPMHERIMNDPLLLMMAVALVILLGLVLLAFVRGGRREILVDERSSGLGPRVDNRNVQPTGYDSRGYETAEAEASSEPERTSAGKAAGSAATAAAAAMPGAAAPQATETRETTESHSAHPGAEPEEEVGEPMVVDAGDRAPAGGMDDVLAEVDVCLAYGMNDQVVETLNAALAEHPDNTQYRLKMVEARIALEDDDGARRAAQELRARLGPEDEAARDRLADLESQIGRGESERGSGGAAGAAASAAAAALPEETQDESGDLPGDLELPDLDTEEEKVAGTSESAASPGEGTAEREETASDQVDQGLSFDIDENLEEDLAKATEAGTSASDFEDDLNNLSFDLDETELSGLGSGDTRSEEKPDSDRGQEDVSLEAGDLVAPEPGSESEAAAEGSGDDEDENVTRLSLAQAYADMGDEEGAQELIDEILGSGTEQQKRDAEAIRQQLKGS